MKKILCYGDSNTFGFSPYDHTRYDKNTRWTSLLQKNLGEDYKVIEEGANNRNAVADNPEGFLYSAQKHFPTMLENIKDIDILIFALGSNDLQFLYDLSLDEIESGVERLILLAKEKIKRIILVPPVILSDNILKGFFKIQFNEKSIIKSKEIQKNYKNITQKHNIELFDFNKFVSPSEEDGLHYSELSHKIIADKLADYIRKG